MGVSGVVSRLLPGSRTDVVIECRHCGVSVAPDIDRCPACDATEIARYEIG